MGKPKTGRKNILRPDTPDNFSYPDDPEFLELCRQDAEYCERIWQGDREVQADAWRQVPRVL